MGEEGVVFQAVDGDGLEVAAEAGEEIADEVVSEGAGGLGHEADLDGAGLGDADEDGQYLGFVAQQHEGVLMFVGLAYAEHFQLTMLASFLLRTLANPGNIPLNPSTTARLRPSKGD